MIDEVPFEESDIVEVRETPFTDGTFFDHGFASQLGDEEEDWEDETVPMPEPGQDSSKGESPKNRTKGPWRKSHVSVLRRLGRRLVDAVRYYAKLYNRSVNSVWRQMMLEVPYGRKANLANLHRQRYRIVHPKRPEGEFCCFCLPYP